MLEIKSDEIVALKLALVRIKDTAIPYAENTAINRIAIDARQEAVVNVRDKMVQRNKWTENSIRMERSKRPGGVARTGSTNEYMRTQEEGATKSGESTIATSYSSGEGQQAYPRKRLPRGLNKMRNKTLRKGTRKATTKRQRNAEAVRTAIGTKQRFVYMETRRGPGIFRVTGTKRTPRIQMVYDMSRRNVVIPRNPWLEPAAVTAMSRGGEHFEHALRLQLKREKLYKNR